MRRPRITTAMCAVGVIVALLTTPVAARAAASSARIDPPPPLDLVCHGSLLGTPLHRPIVGIESTPDGDGYWLVAADGGIFTFGDAHYYGSTGAMTLNQPVIGMQRTVSGRGYWLAAADGGVFAFGNAPYLGGGPITQDGETPTDFSAFAAANTSGSGYILADRSRAFLLSFGEAQYYGLGFNPDDTSPLAGLTSPFSGYYSYWEATAAGGVYTLTQLGQTTC